MMKKWQTIIVFCTLLTLVGVYGAIVSPTIVWGQDGTIPTRTPTPGPGGPTATSSSPTDTPPTDTPPTSPPAATATAIPAVTATSTVAAATFTPTSTVISGFPIPEAEQCGEPPTITSLVIVNIYAGPGSDYPVVETLAKDEVRTISGRAQYAEWWLVELDNSGEEAWINDKAGVVNGYTGNVPIVAAPDIDGETPTPGTPWNPTPVPNCTVTPTATATSTETVTATATITPTATDAATTSSEKTGSAASTAEETKSTAADTTEGDGEVAANNSAQPNNRNAEADAKTEADATAVPLESASNSSNASNILPIAGLGLIVGAIFGILFLRRARAGGEAAPTDE